MTVENETEKLTQDALDRHHEDVQRLKAIPLSTQLDTKACNGLKQLKAETMGDFTKLYASEIASVSGMGAATLEKIYTVLIKNRAFVRGLVKDQEPKHLRAEVKKIAEAFPNLKDMLREGNLEIYLKGQDRSKPLFLKGKEQLSAAQIEQKHIDDFVMDSIANDVSRSSRSVKMLLDQVPDTQGGVFFRNLNRENGKGQYLDNINDLVMAGGQKLKNEYGFTADQIETANEKLKEFGLNLNMRDKYEGRYHQDIQERIAAYADIPTDPQKLAKMIRVTRKNGEINKFFTAS